MTRITSRCSVSASAAASSILLAPCIGPLQSGGNQLHQMIHDHTTALLWIEQRVSEPGVDAPGPLTQVQFWKRWMINPFQSQQNMTHFPLSMAGNPTIRLDTIEPAPKVQP